MTKACNARFGEIVKNYAEINAMKGKGKLAFRAGLLAPQNDSNSSATKSSEIDSLATLKSTTMRSTQTTTQTTTDKPNIPFASPGSNGAMHNKFLKGQVFILVGSFVEVNTDTEAANTAVTSMLESFGAKVNGRFSNKTSK